MNLIRDILPPALWVVVLAAHKPLTVSVSGELALARRVRWLGVLVLVPALAVALAACQSKSAVSDLLDPAALDGTGGSPAGPTQKTLTLGKGGTKVSMLLPLSATGTVGENGRKMRDAAQLAMADLGNEFITLTIQDTRGDSPLAKTLAVEAMGSGSKVVIGPSELGAVRQLSKLSGSKRPPVLALAENFSGSPGVYSVRLSEADSAAAAAAAIAAQGGRKFVLLSAAGAESETIGKRVSNSLSIYGASLMVSISYTTTEGGIEKAVADLAALVDRPDAIIVASGSGNGNPSAVVSALRNRGFLGKGVSLIGTNRWLERPLDDPLLDSAYIATLDLAETDPIAVRFKSTFNYEPDVNVAYAYDMVALAAGVTSALGPEGMKKEVLESRTGFRGSTGLFRFRSDGASERSMPFYRIKNGALVQVAKSTSSF